MLTDTFRVMLTLEIHVMSGTPKPRKLLCMSEWYIPEVRNNPQAGLGNVIHARKYQLIFDTSQAVLDIERSLNLLQ